MAQPSKVGPVFLTIFALPFIGGGLLFIYPQTVSGQNFKPTDLAAGLVIASFVVFMGVGLIFAAFKGYGILKKQAALRDANPLAPWLWRADWALRRSESANKKSYLSAWIAAVFVNLLTFPFMFGQIPQLLRNGDPRVFILLAFCSFGALLTVNAVRATIRHERFGDSYLDFDPLPVAPGRRLNGKIQLRFETQARHGVDLRLSCVRRVTTGSGKNRSVSSVTLWESDKNVATAAIEPGPLGRAVPVEFELPADGLTTDHNDPSDQILWLLHAQADIPGVDYSDDFELPVFRTAGSPQPAPASGSSSQASRFGFATAQNIGADSGEVDQPARTKAVVSMHDGGTEFYFPPLRTPARALMMLVVSVAFTGGAYVLFQSRAPRFFSAIFALADLLVVYGFFHVALGSARIFVGNGEIQSRGGILGFGALRRTPFSEVGAIVPVASIAQGGSSDHSIYSVQLRTKSGKKFTLADEISSRQEARWIVSQLETLAGLKIDTRVEVNLAVGVQAQPVQLRDATGTVRGPTSGSSWIPLAVFGAMVIALFAWRGKAIFAGGPRTPRTYNSRAATSSRPRPAAALVFSRPMADADVDRVLTLPPQAQAEELFERLVGHDERALAVFDEQVQGWIGHIHQSERLAPLLQRAQFSRDLRIRLAHADMSLTLDGWHKNEQAAEVLIQRVQTDRGYKPAALYFLGMLAGRGVAYDRIHRVLLDYARNDRDATSRRWAVEGLRFLGKDEVLDELFASFSEDPSMNVRSRAGCNISECGIFTRKQRMRMVPKLIDLAAKQSTSAETRNWCFLALQEITDAGMPADALAWNRWYADHGAEKMAEFERLEWWQVRGDQ
jgi:hypothetical protein